MTRGRSSEASPASFKRGDLMRQATLGLISRGRIGIGDIGAIATGDIGAIGTGDTDTAAIGTFMPQHTVPDFIEKAARVIERPVRVLGFICCCVSLRL